MPSKRKQSIEVFCHAAQDMPSGVTSSLLLLDPNTPLDGEYLMSSLRKSNVELVIGRHYRVTFTEIEAPK
jgi:hypothetical protein